jgi:glutamine---fructose-6-phosphate transaminase (isomerizing)
MDSSRFRDDLEAKPAALAALARAGDPFTDLPRDIRRLIFLGMGSSRYAAGVAARRLRAAGIDAVAEYASAPPYPPRPGTLIVAISASGGSAETLDALAAYRGRAPIMAITNVPGSPVCDGADITVPMLAGTETGGVACRSYQHTLVLLLALEARLTGRAPGDLVDRAADASADLLDRRGGWLDATLELLDGPHGVYALAPAARIASAQQAALMVREGPRRPADACETGDWAHVDVYLAKTLDYRALLFAGSRYDGQAMGWMRQRSSTVVAVGADVPGAARSIRYRGDHDPDVALLTEVLVAELVAAAWWSSTT